MEMEAGEGIGIVLGRASELRWKINNFIIQHHHHNNSSSSSSSKQQLQQQQQPLDEDEEEEEEESEGSSLLNIHDALESLENQLSSLQVLQQQQTYEKEMILAEIDQSRKVLLKKLKEYKGEDLEVIHEASAFASETVEHNDDLLLLPPYPSRPPKPVLTSLDKNYTSDILSTRTSFTQNGVDEDKKKKKTCDSDHETQSPTKSLSKGLRHVIFVAAKTVITAISVISVLSLAGFEPRLRRKNTQFKIPDPFQNPTPEERSTMIECPPGKVLVVENGEPRCMVKERIEVPFESVVTTPNISYGCG